MRCKQCHRSRPRLALIYELNASDGSPRKTGLATSEGEGSPRRAPVPRKSAVFFNGGLFRDGCRVIRTEESLIGRVHDSSTAYHRLGVRASTHPWDIRGTYGLGRIVTEAAGPCQHKEMAGEDPGHRDGQRAKWARHSTERRVPPPACPAPPLAGFPKKTATSVGHHSAQQSIPDSGMVEKGVRCRCRYGPRGASHNGTWPSF